MVDLTGQTFGRLSVIKLHEIKRYKSAKNQQTKAYYLVQCECNNQKIVRGEHLKSGRTISCGCYALEATRKANTTHGMCHTSEYKTWLRMRNRILNPDAFHKKYYANIKLCNRWNKFENFLHDMGLKPTPKHEIDRINVFGDYEPNNCRWATRSEQMKNTRRSKQYV